MDSEMPVMRCSFCSFVTDNRRRYNDHVKMHQNIRDIPCGQCGKLFVTKKTLRQHIIKVHQRAAAKAAGATSPTSASIAGRSIVIPKQAQKRNDKFPAAYAVTAAETNSTSSELVDDTDVADNLHSSSSLFQSPTAVQAAVPGGSHPIIVGISLPTIDMATYQTFQPFDLQNARLRL